MNEPRWLSREHILLLHDYQLREYGGLPGLRDVSALESAIDRAKNLWLYEKPSIAKLAAAYAFGIARNHPFSDGNKRVALDSAFIFLQLNGYKVTASEAEAVVMTRALAAGEIGQQEYAAWIVDYTKQVEASISLPKEPEGKSNKKARSKEREHEI